MQAKRASGNACLHWTDMCAPGDSIDNRSSVRCDVKRSCAYIILNAVTAVSFAGIAKTRAATVQSVMHYGIKSLSFSHQRSAFRRTLVVCYPFLFASGHLLPSARRRSKSDHSLVRWPSQ